MPFSNARSAADVKPGDSHLLQESLERRKVHAQIGHRPEEEVAADAADRLEEEERAHCRFAITDAMKPAAETVVDVDHRHAGRAVFSIASSGARPPKCAP